ncbi:MAG: hypothetical protein ACXWUD_09515 [Methylosarcina sp.]
MVEHMSNFLGKLYMIRGDYKKPAVYCLAGVIIYSLQDVLLDWTLHLLHVAFEWFEFGLEELIEHVFHTTRQQTQAIVFYLLLTLGVVICYRLGLKLMALYRKLQSRAETEWAKLKIRMYCFWSDQTIPEKLPLILSGSASIAVMAFFLFS